MSRRRPLNDEEHALWTGFTRSITPLRAAKAAGKASVPPSAAASTEEPKPSRAVPRREPPPPAKSPPLVAFDRRLKHRVARGRDAIDARIDLHGMTQNEAHVALLRFLRRAQSDGARIALVVTGKGRRTAADGAGASGVLRRQVPMWLALPEFRPFVVGFEEAHMSHGGQGALYLRLRRER
jgi:DNA-nicking Smr family endonuclease